MTIRNDRPLKNADWVMTDLRRQIDEGSLAAGDRLASVVDLASRYGVGRSTIREALRSLQAVGLLDIRQGSGTYVRADRPSPLPEAGAVPDGWLRHAATLRHFLEIRTVLETGCASLAARNRTAADLEALSAILREMEDGLGDEEAGERADIRFHERIAEATGNPGLIRFMASLSDQFHETMRDTRAIWFYGERSSAERLLAEHRAIYEAIAAGEGTAAAARMERHLAKVAEVLRRHAGTDGA